MGATSDSGWGRPIPDCGRIDAFLACKYNGLLGIGSRIGYLADGGAGASAKKSQVDLALGRFLSKPVGGDLARIHPRRVGVTPPPNGPGGPKKEFGSKNSAKKRTSKKA